MNDNVADKIRKMAQKTAREKIEAEKKAVEESAVKDIADIETAIGLIQDRALFKKVKVGQFHDTAYVLATEEMFLEDYTGPIGKYTRKGIVFYDREDQKRTHCVFTVNGHSYYDMAFLVNTYESDLEKIARRANRLYEELSDAEQEWSRLKEKRFFIKKLLEQVEKLKEEQEAQEYNF